MSAPAFDAAFGAGSPVVAGTVLQGHARQDLNEKLDDLAPGMQCTHFLTWRILECCWSSSTCTGAHLLWAQTLLRGRYTASHVGLMATTESCSVFLSETSVGRERENTNTQSESTSDGKENGSSKTDGHLNGTAVPANLHTDVLKGHTPAIGVANQQVMPLMNCP